MSAWQRISGVWLVCVCVLLSTAAGSALASSTEETIMQDDNHLVYAPPATIVQTLKAMAALGADRIKVSVDWKIVSPDANSFQRPNFDATNPAAYPPYAWSRYDILAQAAQALGMSVYFQLTPPAPNWAVSRSHTDQGHGWSHYPSLKYYGQFVTAVGRRYSGSYVPPQAQDRSRRALLSGIPVNIPGLTGSGSTSQSQQPPPLPRVNYWGVWNEPNEAGWLNPQFRYAGRKEILIAPALYRGIIYAAYKSLAATGHAHDTFLIGETASLGWIHPLPFVQALYCVDASGRPLSGQAAADVNCPRHESPADFARGNPGLFAASGYAHHPYSFDIPPNHPPILTGELTLWNLKVLERLLDRIFRSYGHLRNGGVPMYLTEWGYKSNPPNPYVYTSLIQQAVWMNQGWWMSYFDPHVRSLTQFQLYDDQPRRQYHKGSKAYWGTFQGGLAFADGRYKPSYYAFRIPIWVPSPHPGRHVLIWGELRPAHHRGTQYAVVEFRRHGGSTKWSTLTELQTDNSEGFLLNRIAIPSTGQVRLGWLNPDTGDVYYSRSVPIS